MPITWVAQSQSGRAPSAAYSRSLLVKQGAHGRQSVGQSPSCEAVLLYQGITPDVGAPPGAQLRTMQPLPALGSQQTLQPGNSGPLH